MSKKSIITVSPAIGLTADYALGGYCGIQLNGSPAGKFGGVFEDRLDLFIKLREELGDKEDSFEPKKIPENTIAAERERLERINELREAQSHTHRQWAYYNRMYACD